MSFLDKDTLYLFCDASIQRIKEKDIYIGCSGTIVSELDNDGILRPLYTRTKLLYDTTNNNSEITAILLGIYEAINNRNRHSKIKLISDSLICISSLRTWIFSWIENIQNEILYSSSGQPVANQDIIINIIQTIIRNNLNIELYHQKGHVTSTQKSLDNAKNVFYRSNGILLSDDEIKTISVFNDMIDKYTKQQLIDQYNTLDLQCHMINPFIYNIYDCNFDIYKKLIERKI